MDERGKTKEARAQLKLSSLLPEVHTRVVKREFTETFKNAGPPTAVRRQMYAKLTTDGSVPNNRQERNIEERIVEFVASNCALGLWPDLRALSSDARGRYDQLWDAAAYAVAGLGVASADRRGNTLYAA